jgi:hypothetical protein
MQSYSAFVNVPVDKSPNQYDVTVCSPGELNEAELKSCFAIIRDGGAVNVNMMRRDLPNSSVLAIVRTGAGSLGLERSSQCDRSEVWQHHVTALSLSRGFSIILRMVYRILRHEQHNST